MKTSKMLAIAALLVAGLTFTSCKKCVECDIKQGSTSVTVKECYENNKEMKTKKEEAEQACEDAKKMDPTYECSCKAA